MPNRIQVRMVKPTVGESIQWENLESHQFLDLTPDVLTLEWRYGSRPINALGYLATPGSGLIALGNPHDKYSIYSQLPGFDPLPGARVQIRILDDSNTQVDGWNCWVESQLEYGEPDIQSAVYLVLRGALGQVATRYSVVYSFLDEGFTGQIFDQLIQDLGWPYSYTSSLGTTRFNSQIAELRNLFRGDRTGIPVREAFQTVAEVEAGRIYDNQQGELVFESRSVRTRHLGSHPTETQAYVSIPREKMLRWQQEDITESIINVVDTDPTEYRASPNEPIDFWHQANELPLSFAVLPYNGTVIDQEFRLRTSREGNIAAISNVGNIEYTVSGAPENLVTVTALPAANNDVLLRIQNLAVESPVVTITSISATKWLAETALLKRSRIRQNKITSINRYGRHVVKYPSFLTAGSAERYDFLDDALNRNSGEDPTTGALLRPPLDLYRVNVTVSPDTLPGVLGVGISDLVVLRGIFGIADNDPTPPLWFVDEVEHDIDLVDKHLIKLSLSHSGRDIVWSAQAAVAGVHTILSR